MGANGIGLNEPEVNLAVAEAADSSAVTAVEPVAGPGEERLEGRIERITTRNPQTGFAVLKVRLPRRREPVAVVGTLPEGQPGERLVAVGRWQTHPQYGPQFIAAAAAIRPPATADDIAAFLGSGIIRQIGPVLAGQIVQAFGERTLSVLEAAPERVREVRGIGPHRAAEIARGWRDYQALRGIIAFLTTHGLDPRFAHRLLAAYGPTAPAILAANPYRLVGEVPGLGFSVADRLGQAFGVRPSAPARLQAATHAALLRAVEDGHTRLERAALIAAVAAVAAVEPALAVTAVDQLFANGTIGATGRPSAATTTGAAEADGASGAPPTPTMRGRLRVYEPPVAATAGMGTDGAAGGAADGSAAAVALGLLGLVRAEEGLAYGLRRLAGGVSGLAPSAVDAWLARDVAARDLADEQRAAVRLAALTRLLVLTGGPGTGKTTTVRTLVRLLGDLGRSVALAAPTGKAAKRLGEVVGLEARTLHRLLGAGPHGFRHGVADSLPHEVVIVDEASMLDTTLARAVVAAIGPASQLVLVGDADQLPSVGPGQVLRDLLASGVVPAIRLERVFRQAAQSQIVVNAHRIRCGELPVLAPASALLRESDCIFVPVVADRVAAEATTWAAERLPQALGVEPREVQALAPLTRVCAVVNEALQARLNPARPGLPERPHGALPLRVGDRVIQTRNNYNLGDGVFNGDTGMVVAIDDEGVQVDLGDGQVIAYAPADLLDLQHAYCLTVHRSQGSEWPGVVVLLSSAYGAMLSRNLLYTALTRARRAAVIVGDTAAIARAVAEVRDLRRSTGLVALLAREAGNGAGGE